MPLRTWCIDVSDWIANAPTSWANGITVVLFIAIAAACFLLPRRKVVADAPTARGWRDLRWWAVALITIQLGIYLVFR